MDIVEKAVARWRRKLGPTSLFGIEDARQIARIAVWRHGDNFLAAYRDILDEHVRLHKGFRQGMNLEVEISAGDQGPPEMTSESASPETRVYLKQILSRLDRYPDEKKRRIFTQHLEGLHNTEIAEREGCSSPTVAIAIEKVRVYLLGVPAKEKEPEAEHETQFTFDLTDRARIEAEEAMLLFWRAMAS